MFLFSPHYQDLAATHRGQHMPKEGQLCLKEMTLAWFQFSDQLDGIVAVPYSVSEDAHQVFPYMITSSR